MTVSTPTTSADPSMDEILASIRRMLKEDDQTSAGKTSSPTLDASAPPSPELGDVIALDTSMLDPTAAQPAKAEAAPELAPNPAPTAAPTPAEQPAIAKVADFRVPSFEAFQTTEPAKSAQPAPALSAEPVQSGSIGDDVQQVAFSSTPDIDMPSGIIGEQTARESSRHIGSLVRTLHGQRRVALSRGGPTIEDIVREELRPMLKSWLDANLSSIVERVVRAEIDRLIDPSDR
jgi:cell pole-organizing protein PopZ